MLLGNVVHANTLRDTLGSTRDYTRGNAWKSEVIIERYRISCPILYSYIHAKHTHIFPSICIFHFNYLIVREAKGGAALPICTGHQPCSTVKLSSAKYSALISTCQPFTLTSLTYKQVGGGWFTIHPKC